MITVRDAEKVLNDIYSYCLEKGGDCFSEFESLYCH